MHTLIHVYIQPHIHAHATHKYACTFTHTTPHTHTHTHTHTHAHTNTLCMQKGYCPLHYASQKGHDRVMELLLQAGVTVDLQSKVENCVLLSFVLCHAHYWLYTMHHHNTQEKMNVRKQIQQITAADTHLKIKSFVHWKQVHFMHGLGRCFPQKTWTENSSLGSKLQWIF